MRSEDEVDEGETFESETSFYRELTTRNKRIIRRRVRRLAALLNELIAEDKDLESMFGKSTERYFRHYPKFRERAGLGRERILMQFFGMKETVGIRLLQSFLRAEVSTNGLRMSDVPSIFRSLAKR
jgi:ribosomal protein L16 Arg81 hydroxylase